MVEQQKYGSAPAGQVDTTLRDLLAVVFRRKWLILGIFGVTTALVGIKEFSSPTSYLADATLLLNRQAARASVLERSGRVLPWTEVIESEVEVVRSGPVMERARQLLATPTEKFPDGIQLNPRQIARKISVGNIGESNVLFVSGSDGNADVAIAMTNAVAESYVAYHQELYELPDASGMIRTQADTTLANLDAAEKRRSELLAQIGVNEVHEEERSLVGQRERLRGQLSEIERDLARLDVELDDARRYLSGEADAIPFYENTGSIQGNALSTTAANLSRRRADLNLLREKYTDEHPQVRAAAAEVSALEAEVRERTGDIIRSREHQRRALASERTELTSQVEAISAKLQSLPGVDRKSVV